MDDFSQQTLSAFLQAHPERGSLRVQISSGGGAFPVSGAQVAVFRRFGGLAHVFFQGSTDASGLLGGIPLPARPAAWSQTPDTAADSGTDYLVTVRHPLFVEPGELTVTLFARIESILPVMLEPET